MGANVRLVSRNFDTGSSPMAKTAAFAWVPNTADGLNLYPTPYVIPAASSVTSDVILASGFNTFELLIRASNTNTLTVEVLVVDPRDGGSTLSSFVLGSINSTAWQSMFWQSVDPGAINSHVYHTIKLRFSAGASGASIAAISGLFMAAY